MRHVVRAKDQELRLDRWLRRQFPDLPQSFLQTQLRKRKIRLQDANATSQSTRANSILREGSVIAIDAHLFQAKMQHHEVLDDEDLSAKLATTPETKKRLQELLQRVVYRNEQFLVLNKPHGLAVQEGSALTDSLERYLPALAVKLGGRQHQEPLKLVHRLDKETSGLLVLARSRLAAARFSELLRSGEVQKTYEALVTPTQSLKRFEGREVVLPVDGKAACTLVERVIKRGGDTSQPEFWLQLKPRTGRKHQLRVHCAQGLKAPIVGDVKYGSPPSARLYLHAKRLQFPDPFRPGQVIDVSCSSLNGD